MSSGVESGEEKRTAQGQQFSAEELATTQEQWLSGAAQSPPVQRSHPVLPKEGARNILISSALPYVNNVPHLGNIIGCVLSADVFSRFCRLRGYNSLYVCGTDEYGTATETKALEEGLTPKQICDKYNAIHKEIYQWFNIDFDTFGRTSTEDQTKICQDIFWKLQKKGLMLEESVKQLFCDSCSRFLADRYVEGMCPYCGADGCRGDQCDKCGKLINAIELITPKCQICKSSPTEKTSNHLFLDLPTLQPSLEAHLKSVFEKGIWTNNAKGIVQAWLRDGLKPRCISRDLTWGVPVPLEGYTSKVFYVWFDAPIGYISITAGYTPEHWEKWWKHPKQVEYFNFLGKDNVTFHAAVFPSMLLGADDNFTVVTSISATEYLNYEDDKFSKSRGVGVFGNDAQTTGIEADIYRFYLLFVRPENQDTVFSWTDLVLKNNTELLNNLGNFVNRALSFLDKNFGGVVPQMKLNQEDLYFLSSVHTEITEYLDHMEHVRLREALRSVLSVSRLGNQMMQSAMPWVLVKGSAEEKARGGTIIGLATNLCLQLSIMLKPFMPHYSKVIQEQLNASDDCYVLHEYVICRLQSGHKIGTPAPLFRKIEDAEAEELRKRFAGRGKKPAQEGAAAVVVEDLEKLKLQHDQQGEFVRELKANKAAKEEIDRAVAALLDIKKCLKLAGGVTDAVGKKDNKDTGGKKKSDMKKGGGDQAAKSQNGPQKT